MNVTRLLAVAVLIVASGVALHPAQAQAPGITCTDLPAARPELFPGGEVIQVVGGPRAGSAGPQATPIRAKRSSTSWKACWSTRSEGKPPVTLKAGDVLFIPAGAAHSARNVGTTNGAELATYIVERDAARHRGQSVEAGAERVGV